MCGFYSRDEIGRDDFIKIYGVANPDKALIEARYNIRPKTVNVVVTRNSPNQAEPMLWWYHPGWDGFPENRGVINARIESLKENKSYFKKAFLSQRCLIPASHWIEWKELQGVKIPHAFRLKSRKFFAFAGLWNEFTDTRGKQVKGYCIITTTPNALAEKIHNRQPAVLREKDQNSWLDPDEKDIVSLLSYLEVYPADDMEIYPVAKDLSENSPKILKPISKVELNAEISSKTKPHKKARIKISIDQGTLI
ncbi:MAG: SOS response-associated peptidase [Patescibacteria group bacterium]